MEGEEVKIINRYRKGYPQGKLIEVTGKAVIVNKGINSKLKVQFFWPFKRRLIDRRSR